MKTVHLENKKSRLFVNLFTEIPDIPTKLNSRRIGYPGKQKGESRNMERNPRVFSRIPAPRFRDDRLHRREVPNSSYTKSDFIAMKTVVMVIICASYGINRFSISFKPEKKYVKCNLIRASFLFSGSFYTIRGSLITYSTVKTCSPDLS